VTELDATVLSVGAGVAGLAAARVLHDAGIRAVVVEARDRIGGRILTVRDAQSAIPIELGAEFVHGESHSLWSILRDAHLAVCDVSAPHVTIDGGAVKARDELFDAVDAFVSHAAKSKGPSVADALASWKRFRRRGEVRQSVRNYVEGFHAAYPERFSVRAFVGAERAGSDSLARVVSGYDGVPRALAEALDVRLGHVVTAIRWSRHAVEASMRRSGESTSFTMRARTAIVTLPLGVLRAPLGAEGSVQFEPPVATIATAARGLEMGTVVRIVLRFREAFWEQHAEAGGAAFLHASDVPIPTWWTARPMRTRTLVGWVGGPRAEALLRESPNAILSHALDSLASMFAIERTTIEAQLAGWHLHDWLADPFSRGAYSYVGLAGETAAEDLAAPTDDTLYFAGEATHTGNQWGTVHGAIESGRRAARQVIERL
jgi:monoamine oxidase